MKTPFKKRLKRALANFLKDELLELVGYSPMPPFPTMVGSTGNIGMIKAEFDIALTDNPYTDHTYDYERELEQAKKKMFRSIEPCIKVETHELISPEYYGVRRVRMSLMVQNPEKVNAF